MDAIKYVLPGAVMVVAGIALRFLGGDTDIGPINLGATGNVLWILGAVELVAVLWTWSRARE